MSNRLQDKVAIVTGGAQGIGEAIVRRFTNQGAKVVIADIDEEKALTLSKKLAKQGDHVEVVSTDVTRPESVSKMVDFTVKKHARIDILVNNAGLNVFGEPLKISDDDWLHCLSVDLEGTWYCCKHVLPIMLHNKSGSIINISSVHGDKVIPHCFPYPVAKHGVIGLTKALGVEYAAQNIRVNAISPGYIETPMTEAYLQSCDDPKAERKRQIEILPPKRLGQPDEVAMAAVFLASDEASFVNATTLTVDGGRSAVYHD